MAAAEGNKYAEKWTKEAVMEKLTELQSIIETTTYIGEGLATIGLYHEWFSYVGDKFKDDDDVFHTIKKIEQAYEVRLVKMTLKGEYNPTMSIFTLKNKHSWKDKTEVDSNNNHTMTWKEEKTYEANEETNHSS
jgi:hypothetical protein